LFPIRDSVSRSRAPVVVWAIIGLNVAVFLHQLTLSRSAELAFVYRHALVPLRYFNPEWAWDVGLPPTDATPFFSSMFMHGGLLHIVLNLWTLWIFGPALEDRLGPVRFSALYLGSGLAAGLAHTLFNAGSPQPMLGASGAIAGVIGAYALRFPYAWVRVLVPIVIIPLFFSIPALVFAGIWFLLQVMQGASELFNPFAPAGGIAWWAHIGGFIAGVFLLRLLEPSRSAGGRQAWYNGGPWEQFGRRR
jgi:membrane associated rhomboid family serine protease